MSMQVPPDRSYTKDHEWARVSDGVVEVGITDYAQDALGDIVYVKMPAVGDLVAKGDAFAEVDSTKSVSDIFSPVTGTVIEVNDALTAEPELLNSSPYDQGWIARIQASVPSDLEVITPDEYSALIAI